MSRPRAPRPSPRPTAAKRSRKHRSRPTPRWLTAPRTEEDEVARRRCLMVLTVLSGAQPVSDAIAEARISRGTYYKLESQALAAMLEALRPGAPAGSPGAGPAARIAELEAKVRRLEQDKRRTERLLFLTRRVVRPGPVTTGAGRPAKKREKSSSTRSGGSASRGSKPKTSPAAERMTSSPSTPSSAGAAGPSPGNAS